MPGVDAGRATGQAGLYLEGKAGLLLALDSSNFINGTGFKVDGGASIKM